MLKHATICRTKRAGPAEAPPSQQQVEKPPWAGEPHQEQAQSSPNVESWLASVKVPASPSPIAVTSTSTSTLGRTSATQRPGTSRSGSSSSLLLMSSASSGLATAVGPSPSSAESMIKIHAQSLSQDVEYMTLHVNPQTTSRQIIRSLLRKFRLKHRDPNLFFLVLERWIRKDGLKSKSIMVLGDDACPLQLQQCCSSPPHNDIKFILETRPGSLVKIFCQDVSPSTKYKCLSLSRHTTAEETIELMLHCLESKPSRLAPNGTTSTTTSNHQHHRQASSPASTDSSSTTSSSSSSSSSSSASSSASTTSSSSSGIESDSTAATSQSAGGAPFRELYRLVIENSEREVEGAKSRRVLQSEEALVDVYQELLDELAGQSPSPDQVASPSSPQATGLIIKLIKFTSPPARRPLPPIPTRKPNQCQTSQRNPHLLSHFNRQATHHYSVSTSSLATADRGVPPEFLILQRPPEAPARLNLAAAAVAPTVKPRLSTFGGGGDSNNHRNPPTGNPTATTTTTTASGTCNSRRRYDPAQLAEDLDRLDLVEDEDCTPSASSDSDNCEGKNEARAPPDCQGATLILVKPEMRKSTSHQALARG